MTFDFGEEKRSPAQQSIIELISEGNLELAEIEAREMFCNRAEHATAFNFLGCIAVVCGLKKKAEEFFNIATAMAPDWAAPKNNIVNWVSSHSDATLARGQSSPQRFLLIKAWGAGFWSDVAHVIGQALLAELSNRTPIVHWGANSLFWSGARKNAFDAYFDPIADLTEDVLMVEPRDIWPPKWNQKNLFAAEVNKWHGSFSRMAGLYLLGREEELLVSDFFSSVFDLTLWIPAHDTKYSMTFDELYTYLVRKYLHPKREITERAAEFSKSHLGDGNFISVHARGSDKLLERPGLDELNSEYYRVIDEWRQRYDTPAIFLMTDDARLLDHYIKRYGDDVVFTDCERTSTLHGVHFLKRRDPERLGIEVMVDAYIATRGVAFLGNGSSNSSQAVRYLGTWSKEDVRLLGDNVYRHQRILASY